MEVSVRDNKLILARHAGLQGHIQVPKAFTNLEVVVETYQSD